MSDNITKVCFKCNKEKPLSQFYVHKEMKDGHLNKCKDCTKLDTITYRKTNPFGYFQTRLKTHSKNPTKYNARKVVEAAILAGVMIKPDVCDKCGTVNEHHGKCKLHAHHKDHNFPLSVVYLCPKCHAEADSHKFKPTQCNICGRMISKFCMSRHKEACERDNRKDTV